MRIVLVTILLFSTQFAAAGKKLKVLFLGNSYTAVNNMPQIVSNIATAGGDTLVFDMYAPGGYRLDDHGRDSISRVKIKNGGWDYLVFQEQSQLPSFPSYQSNELYGMCSLFRDYNPCGRIMFYMTWGRQNGDATNCPVWPPVCTYGGMDSLIRLRYIQLAVNNKGVLSPVGAAWRNSRYNNPSLNLYDTDGSHPSAAGSYLAACCFYTSLFKKDPTGITYNFSLNTADADMVRQAVKSSVFDSLAFWDHASTTPVADFRYDVGPGLNQVQFINKSSLADHYLWDFGDGNTSTLEHPAHSYTANGVYTVKLTAYNCDVENTFTDTKQVVVSFCPFSPTVIPGKITLCPWTTDTLRTQAYDAYQWYDANDMAVPGANKQLLPISSDNRYYVEASLNGCTERSVPADVYTASAFSTWYIIPSGKLIGEDSACAGDTVALAVMFNKPPVTDDSLIDWTFNGQPITGYHNDTLLISRQGIYEAKVRHNACPVLDKTMQINFTFVNCNSGIIETNNTDFRIFPNPATGVLIIHSDAFLSGQYEVNIMNAVGKNVYRQQSSSDRQQQIDMSALPGGLYIVHISGDNIQYRGKVLKQ